MAGDFAPEQVLGLWFPDNGHWEDPEAHRAFWAERMRGGMDDRICRDYAGLTRAAARSELDHWAETPRGRLALLIALDQFPRSLWRDTPAAFGQDIKACQLTLEALENGHYHALPHGWERQFYLIALGHCEGPDHLDRMDLCVELSKAQADIMPPPLAPLVQIGVEQAERIRDVIRRFGRHPHRNPIYGRLSSDAEQAYIDAGDFPHQRDLNADRAATAGG